MPRSPQRLVALAGMATATPFAAWLFVVCWRSLSGAYGELEVEDLARGEMLASFATIAATAAVACLIGLGLRRRLVTAVGAVVVLACAAAAPWLTRGWGVPGDLGERAILLAAVGVVAAGVAGLWAACTPSS